MVKVLFVCHGNICRSPMAEFIMKKKVEELGLASQFYIASAATSTEEIWGDRGNPVYPPAKKELAKHGIGCAGKTAVQLRKSDYQKYDFLIGMDSMNMRNIHRMLGADPNGKVYKLLSFADSDRDISDPWYSGRFDVTYDDICEGCDGLIRYLMESGMVR